MPWWLVRLRAGDHGGGEPRPWRGSDVSPRRHPPQEGSHVLLEAAKGDQLRVPATDLDVSISSDPACEVLRRCSSARRSSKCASSGTSPSQRTRSPLSGPHGV